VPFPLISPAGCGPWRRTPAADSRAPVGGALWRWHENALAQREWYFHNRGCFLNWSTLFSSVVDAPHGAAGFLRGRRAMLAALPLPERPCAVPRFAAVPVPRSAPPLFPYSGQLCYYLFRLSAVSTADTALTPAPPRPPRRLGGGRSHRLFACRRATHRRSRRRQPHRRPFGDWSEEPAAPCTSQGGANTPATVASPGGERRCGVARCATRGRVRGGARAGVGVGVLAPPL